MKRVARGLLAALVTWPLWAAAATPSAASEPGDTVTLVCEAVYMPARATWTRTVVVNYDQRRIRQVAIDGQAVYTFAIQESVILTSQDNERIQIDTAALTWSSDFRGLATAQGRCERG